MGRLLRVYCKSCCELKPKPPWITDHRTCGCGGASHPTLVVELEALAVMGVINSAPTLPTIDKVYTFCFVFWGGVTIGAFPGGRAGTGLGASAARHHQKLRLPPRSPQAALIAVLMSASRSLDPRLQSDQKVTHDDTS